MRFPLRPSLTTSLALLLGSCTGTPTEPAPETASRSAGLSEEQSTLEEDYAYPGAEAYLALGIRLKSGDGNLLLVDCSTPDYSLVVESFAGADPFCFKLRGPRAALTLELPEAFLVRSNVAGATATVVANGQSTTVKLNLGQFTTLVQGSGSSAVYPTLVGLQIST